MAVCDCLTKRRIIGKIHRMPHEQANNLLSIWQTSPKIVFRTEGDLEAARETFNAQSKH